MVRYRPLLVLGLLFGAFALPRAATAQCVSLTTLGSASTQNFDTLSNTAGSTTNNLTIPGWFLTESGGGARDNEQYGVDTGASTTGDTYSYGSAAATDRALGGLRSGTLIPTFGACFTNNTGSTIGTLAIAYTGEEWRLGAAARTDQINFEYSTTATDLVTGTWTGVAALNFVTPDTATAGAKNGNAAADRTALSNTISSLSIANGATFWIRWTDTDPAGADDGLAVDDFSLTPNGAVATPNLTINDVSLNEGNAGTTSFTFTVSLSIPAGAGGVTFDIATADGTAVAPGDYTTKSLTAQTIPAGSSTYSFTVLVNGDTTPETNETFFVNVTNVTGATTTDGQGQGTIVNDDAAPNLTINDVSLNEGNAGTTTFTFTVSLSAPAGAGGVTFDIATANGTAIAPGDYTTKSLTGQTIPAGNSTYTFDVLANGDTTPETDETFFVNVTNVTNAIAVDGQGQGTIVNDDLNRIHDVQGNGAATPIPGATVSVEGVVIANFQGSTKLQGFFLEEEDADHDADPQTSEGIFIFCSSCPTAVAEGQRVRVTGSVSEFNNKTEITASTAGSVVVTEAGNHLAEVTPAALDLPVVGVIDTFYEAREGMRVTFVDALSVSEYFELARYGQIELYEGGRPRQYTEGSVPSAAGLTAHLDGLDRRRVILDDDNNTQNVSLTQTTGLQFLYHPRANGGFSVGTQGVDFFRGGDLVNGLTGVLDWSFAGLTGTDAWRVRPTAASPATFTVVNPRPAAPPGVGGAIKVVGMNLLNYFTTIDTTASSSSGPCGPDGLQDCRGADSVAELNRQRERASVVICALNADAYGLVELENTTASATITDLLGAVNTRCGGAHPYAFVNTGGTLGTDAIRVQLIYRTGVLSPVGSPLSDLDPIHNRPPTAQTFDVVDATNPAFGQRFTVVANHFKSKGCGGATGGDLDMSDGQGCFAARRTSQATRLLTWISTTVIPAAGDPDVLLVGDFNSYAQEPPVTTLTAGGYVDLATTLLGPNAYSYLFDGQLGHLDYAFASSSLFSQVTGIGNWHINADEVDVFDYSDEILDTGESSFEEKPDGSALVPPRVLFQSATAVRASDHDPVLVGLFTSADVSVTKLDTPDPVTAGTNLVYTITVANAGPDAATNASFSDPLPAGTTFVSLSSPGGWSCTTPAVGAAGTVSCSTTSLAVGSAAFTLTVAVAPTVAAGTVLSNTATATSTTGDPNPGNQSATATTTVATSADLSISKVDTPDPVTAGNNLTYTLTVANAGPSNAASAVLADTLPAGTTFVSLTAPGGWSCTTPAVGAGGTVNCSIATLGIGNAVFTLVVNVGSGVAVGTVISNTATVLASTNDPVPGNGTASATTTVGASADVSVTKVDTPDPVTAGNNLTYTVTVANAGPSSAATVALADTLPAGTTFVSLAAPGGWSCTVPAVGAGGTVNCSIATLGVGNALFTLVVNVGSGVTAGTVISNTATASAATTDPNPGNGSATATTTVAASADVSVTKVDTPDPVVAGSDLTYTVTVANAGPSGASSVALADTLPAGTTFVSLVAPGGWTCTTPAVGAGGTVNCSIATLGVGNAVFTLVVNVGSGVTAGTVISNTATTSAAAPDPVPGNGSATATTTVAAVADLVTQKTAAPNPVAPGGTLNYGITVANNGPSTAQAVTLADTLPAGTTFVSLASEPGWSCTTPAVGSGGTVNCSVASLPIATTATFTLVVQVGTGVTAGSTLTNTAIAASATTEGAPGNESAVAVVTVSTATADLSILKSDSADPVPVGSNLTYTLTLNNEGPSTATSVVVSDPLPAETTFQSLTAPGGWSCTTPAVGATGTVTCSLPSFPVGTAVFTVGVQVASGTQLTNTASVTATSADPQPGNETATEVTTVGETNPNLTIAITDSPDPVDAGQTVTYSVSATSALAKNSNVQLTDVLPAQATFQSLVAPAGAWSCTTPAVGATGSVVCTLASWAGGTVGFAVTVAVPATVPPGTVLHDAASISVENSGRPFVASDSEDTVVNTPASLSATKVASGSFEQGSTVTYTLVLTNAGPATQADNPGDELTDVLPPELTLVSASATSGTALANVGTNTVTWNGTLAPGASVTITVEAFLPDALDAGLVISNQAQVAFDADGNGTNEAAASSDDPGVDGNGDPTDIVVVARVNVLEIPTLGEWGLVLLASLLGLAAAFRIGRRS